MTSGCGQEVTHMEENAVLAVIEQQPTEMLTAYYTLQQSNLYAVSISPYLSTPTASRLGRINESLPQFQWSPLRFCWPLLFLLVTVGGCVVTGSVHIV